MTKVLSYWTDEEWERLVPAALRDQKLNAAHGKLRSALNDVAPRHQLALVQALLDDLTAEQREPDSAPAVPVDFSDPEEPTLISEKTERMTADQYAEVASRGE